MSPALKAGIGYFAIVFAAGFVLGTVRVLALAPHLGAALAVAIELPLMLAVSWIACRRIVARFSVPKASGPRLAMGATALVLLIAAEMALAVFAFGQTVSRFLESYQAMEGALGLLGQIAFGVFPLLQLRQKRHRPASR